MANMANVTMVRSIIIVAGPNHSGRMRVKVIKTQHMPPPLSRPR